MTTNDPQHYIKELESEVEVLEHELNLAKELLSQCLDDHSLATTLREDIKKFLQTRSEQEN